MPLSTPDNFQQELDLLFAAADEFAESPGSTTLGEKRSSPDDDQNGENSVVDDEDVNPGNESQAGSEDQTPSEQQLFIKRLSKRLKLNNMQAANVEKFSKETISTKLVVLYGETISLLDKVNKLTENVGPASFTLTKEITENIKLITKQTFFNPAVRDYKKEDTVKLLVIDRVRHSPGIPKNLEEINPHAWAQIESKVGSEVTQLRGAIKKVLKEDSQLDPGKQMKIHALSKAVVGKTAENEIKRFGVELHMRVALFRKVYQQSPGDDFWDTVDSWLQKILKGGYEKAMTGLIQLDRGKYGIGGVDTTAQ